MTDATLPVVDLWSSIYTYSKIGTALTLPTPPNAPTIQLAVPDGHMLHVTCGTDLALLGIEEYMDLSITKLCAQFDESVMHPASLTSSVPILSTPRGTGVDGTRCNLHIFQHCLGK